VPEFRNLKVAYYRLYSRLDCELCSKGRLILQYAVHATVTEERSYEENVRSIAVSQIMEEQFIAEQTCCLLQDKTEM